MKPEHEHEKHKYDDPPKTPAGPTPADDPGGSDPPPKELPPDS